MPRGQLWTLDEKLQVKALSGMYILLRGQKCEVCMLQVAAGEGAGDGAMRPDGFQMGTNGRGMAKMAPGEVDEGSGRNRATGEEEGERGKGGAAEKGQESGRERGGGKEREEVPSEEPEK